MAKQRLKVWSLVLGVALGAHSPPLDAQAKYEELVAAAERPIEELERAARAAPGSVAALIPLGIARLTRTRTDEAIEIFDTALRIDPDLDYAHLFLAISYNVTTISFPIRANDKSQGALDLTQDDRNSLRALADRHFERAIALSPNDPTVWGLWGEQLFRRSVNNAQLLPTYDPTRIISTFRRALELDPNHMRAHGLAHVLTVHGALAGRVAHLGDTPDPWEKENPARIAQAYLGEAADIYWRLSEESPDQADLSVDVLEIFLRPNRTSGRVMRKACPKHDARSDGWDGRGSLAVEPGPCPRSRGQERAP